MKHLKSVLTLLLACLFWPQARAQHSYFTHTITAGETVYAIAKIYHLTPEDIYRLNPESRQGIQSGQVLRIPQSTQAAPIARFHTIAAGETLFKLTQFYNVSAEELCEANPGLTAANFKKGQVIVIPAGKHQDPVITTQPASQTKFRDMHKVKRKETIFSIARSYGLKTEELIAANPEMKDPDYKLKKGTFVAIPYPTPQTAAPQSPQNENKFPEIKGPKSQNQLTVAVLLPFKQNNSESAKMIEFYRGFLLAVEDLKKQGISVTVYAHDSGRTAGEINQVLQLPGLDRADVIFGPLYAVQQQPLSDFCKKHRIKLVIPFSSQCDAVYSNPYVYVANASKNNLYRGAYDLILDKFSSCNFIIWESGEKSMDDVIFVRGLEKILRKQNIPYQSVSVGVSAAQLRHVLATDRKNIVIPDAASLQALNRMTTQLNTFRMAYPQYEISLLGHPEWQIYTGSQIDNFFKLDTYVYTSFYKNMHRFNCQRFENRFRNWFHTPLQNTYPSFGMLGYDMGRFFMIGIAQNGVLFNSRISGITTDPLQHDFHFLRASNWSGFINCKVELIHYNPNRNIDVIEFKKR